MDLDKAINIIKTEVNNIKNENEAAYEEIDRYVKEIEKKLANIEVYKVEMLELADRRRDVRKTVREHIDACFMYLIASWKYLENFASYDKFVFCLEEQDRIEILRRSVYT